MKVFTFFGFLLRPFFETLRFTIKFFETFLYQVEFIQYKFYVFSFDMFHFPFGWASSLYVPLDQNCLTVD